MMVRGNTMAKFIIDVTDDERKNLLHMIGQAVFKGNECFVYVDMFQKLMNAKEIQDGQES